MSTTRVLIDLSWPLEASTLPANYTEADLAVKSKDSFEQFLEANPSLEGVEYEEYLYGGLPEDEVPVEITVSAEGEDQLLDLFVLLYKGDRKKATELLSEQGYFFSDSYLI